MAMHCIKDATELMLVAIILWLLLLLLLFCSSDRSPLDVASPSPSLVGPWLACLLTGLTDCLAWMGSVASAPPWLTKPRVRETIHAGHDSCRAHFERVPR